MMSRRNEKIDLRPTSGRHHWLYSIDDTGASRTTLRNRSSQIHAGRREPNLLTFKKDGEEHEEAEKPHGYDRPSR
ncbi:hypothetical protein BDN71DRAFT_1458742 [Pleurotus eryngii]|uniref:Uncharacterized protein n=1 Tax=Pleurotus eryngii TaxID=5323 RepID=A0A9P5ZIX4_PLEER|nr:hypothetical protein BDN71DRAFT_1458742 [Pleurotus eryngii]